MRKYLSYEELTKEQKQQVKIWYYDDLLMSKENRTISYEEMAYIDDIINDNDKEFKDYVSLIRFTKEDFESESD